MGVCFASGRDTTFKHTAGLGDYDGLLQEAVYDDQG